jgi:alpha-amylase
MCSVLVPANKARKGQVMDAPVQPEFLPLAYALILLRQAGYPCVFYGDIFGISEPFASKPNYNKWISDLILARKLYAYGEQQDYFQEASCIGWVRKGLSQSGGSQAAGMAVLMSWVGKEVEAHGELSSTARPSWMRRLSSLGDKFGKQRSGPKSYQKRMNVGAQHAGEVWTDVSRVYPERIIIDRDGYGVFTCKKNSVVIYLSESAEGRERFRWYWETDIYHHNAGAWTHVEEIRE